MRTSTLKRNSIALGLFLTLGGCQLFVDFDRSAIDASTPPTDAGTDAATDAATPADASMDASLDDGGEPDGGELDAGF